MKKKECPMGTCKGKMDKIESLGKRVRYVCDKCGAVEDITENGK